MQFDFGMKALLAAHHARHTCKAYDETRKVPDEVMRFIVEVGRLSPSSFGFEPWQFLVIENQKLRHILHETAWGIREKIMECSHCVIILARQMGDVQKDDAYLQHLLMQIQHMDAEAARQRIEKFRRFAKEDFLLDSPRAYYDWACKQSYIALANMLTAAAMVGVDSTAVEGFPLELLHQKLAEQGLYDPAVFKISVMAAFGYTRNPTRPKTRREWDDVVRWIK